MTNLDLIRRAIFEPGRVNEIFFPRATAIARQQEQAMPDDSVIAKIVTAMESQDRLVKLLNEKIDLVDAKVNVLARALEEQLRQQK